MEYTKKLTWSQLDKYKQFMDQGLSNDYFIAHFKNKQNSFNIGIGLINQWEALLQESKAREKQLFFTSSNNNKGIAFENAGKITEAIDVYEKNLLIGYLATHSYTRLMIIYHKEKRYEDEIRVVNAAIEAFSEESVRYKKDIEKWNERFIKLQR